jgi:hypothetical protein
MKPKTLLLLGVTALVAYGAYEVNRNKTPTSVVESALLYPGLLESLNEAQHIDIATASDHFRISRDGERWVLADRDNFPANTAPVRELLLQLAALKIREEKTSRPEQYATLGVEDRSAPKATGETVTVLGKSDARLADLLIGKARKAHGNDLPGHYVRRTGEAAALLVEGELGVKSKRLEWLDTSVVTVPVDRVRKVTINHDSGEPVVVTKASRKEQLFSLLNIPAGKESKSAALVSNVGGLLLDMRFEDVAAATQVTGSKPIAEATLETFDGMVATVKGYEVKGRTLVTLGFEYKPELAEATGPTADTTTPAEAPGPEGEKTPDVASEVKRLNEHTGPWAYQLADYKLRTLKRSFTELIKPIDKTVSATPP